MHSSNAGLETVSTSLNDAENYNTWVLSRFEPYLSQAKSLLEVGVGHANFRTYFGNLKDYVGVDIDPEIVERARQRWSGARFVHCDVRDDAFVTLARDMKPEAILCVSVVQNIPDDSLAMRQLLSALPRSGHLCMFVPAMPMLFGSLDRVSGHFRRYSVSSIRKFVPEGYTLKRADYFNPIGAIGWAINSVFPHTSVEDDAIRAQVRIFDKYVTPISKVVDPFTRRWFGQSLIVVIGRN